MDNALSTAEGATQLTMEELPITISGCRSLITGYGRIGRILSRLLVGLGAQVTVAARKFSDLAWTSTQRCTAVELSSLSDPDECDVIFNTVPHLIFTRDVLSHLDKNTLLIDLASHPGGIDFNAAAKLELKTIWALSLPCRRNDDADRCLTEPYVYSQTMMAQPHPGADSCVNSWLTGTASWMYVAATQYLLGIRPEYEGLCIDPCIPAEWDDFTSERICRGTQCRITVKRGAPGLTVDGTAVDGNTVPWSLLDGKDKVEIVRMLG